MWNFLTGTLPCFISRSLLNFNPAAVPEESNDSALLFWKIFRCVPFLFCSLEINSDYVEDQGTKFE